MRHFPNWLDAYVEHMSNTGSPERFARWAAVSCVAGVLERKVWLKTGVGVVYPNFYIALAGEPGVGKSTQVSMVAALWEGFSGATPDKIHVAPESLTHASIIDELYDAKRQVNINGQLEVFNALSIAVKELGVLLPVYDVQMMAHLTDIYDNQGFSQRRRGTGKTLHIPKTFFNFLAACTPKTLAMLLPEGAWEMGFAARLLCIYAGERSLPDLWVPPPLSSDTYKALCIDLGDIQKMMGQFDYSDEARAALNTWYKKGGPPTPTHPRLQHYNTRRTYTVLKLSIVCAAARSSDLMVEVDDFVYALDLLLEAETQMPEIFKSAVSGGESQVIEECSHMVWEYYHRLPNKPTPVREPIIVQFLAARVTSPNVMRVLEVMCAAGYIEQITTPQGRAYIPGTKLQV